MDSFLQQQAANRFTVFQIAAAADDSSLDTCYSHWSQSHLASDMAYLVMAETTIMDYKSSLGSSFVVAAC
jgi:SRSO17 transposase